MSSSLTATTAFQPYTKPTPSTSSSYQPTHPGLLRVVLEKGKNTVEGEEDAYSSYLVAEEVCIITAPLNPSRLIRVCASC